MAEKRLIDANALDAEMETLMVRFTALGRKRVAEDYNFVRTVLDTAPTIDAVEVVRCKECRWFNTAGCSVYIVDDSDKPKEKDFCSFGERRTDNAGNS